MARVTGLGGVFIKFKHPEKMRQWYKEVLGMTTNDYGVLFQFNHEINPGFLQLGTFESTSSYFGDEQQRYMLNFRVDDLNGLMEILSQKGTPLLGDVESYEYGRFLHIEDPEGNKIELWEPIDSTFDSPESPYMPMR